MSKPPQPRLRTFHSPGRRAFLHRGSLFLAGAAAGLAPACSVESQRRAHPPVRVGLLTDCHYADKEPAGSRHYRDSLAKVRQAVARFNEAAASVAIELGDFVDAAPEVETEVEYLRAIDAEYARFHGERHYVLGNHCVYTLTKEEFLENSAARATYYSFDEGRFHFVVLDACYRSDGVAYGRKNFEWTDTAIPEPELAWLGADLAATQNPTVVFVHQRLDLEPDGDHAAYAVKNAPAVRRVLEASGKVLAVFQGHSHENLHREIGGIHYCVLRAVVEGPGSDNSGHALLNLFDDGSIRIDGFREQSGYEWSV